MKNKAFVSFETPEFTKLMHSLQTVVEVEDTIKLRNLDNVSKAHRLLNSRDVHFTAVGVTSGAYVLRLVFSEELDHRVNFGPGWVITVAVSLNTLQAGVLVHSLQGHIQQKPKNLPALQLVACDALQLSCGHIAMANGLEKLLAELYLQVVGD